MHEASAQLGRDPVGRLLLRFSWPSIAGMVANGLYNIVDRIYIARVMGEDAIGGMSLTFPLMGVITAVGMLVGIGTGTLISMSLGRGAREEAEKYLGQAVGLFLLMYAVLPPLAFWFMDPLLVLIGGTPEIMPHAKQYLQIILAANIVQHLSFGLNNSMRAEGYPGRALATILIGAVLNAILDPFFIFPEFLGWGVRGAAIATALSQTVSSVWVLAHFLSPRSAARLRWRNIRIHPALAWKMLGIGLSPFTVQIIGSLIVAVFNISFKHYAGADACATYIAAMGIIQSINMILIMPIFGVTQGMQPILGYNYAAGAYARVKRAYRLALVAAIAIGAGGTLFTWVFARPISELFIPDETGSQALYDILPHYLRVTMFAFPVVGFSITTSQYFLAIGRSGIAIATTLLRQVIVLLPALLILPVFLGIPGIWYSAPFSDIISFLIALCVFLHERKRLNALIAAHV